MKTQITTQARRMQRELAKTPASMDVLFSANGDVVGGLPAGAWFLEGHSPDYTIRLTGGTYTQRDMQDWLDAVEANPAHPEDYIADLRFEREYA